MLFDLLILATLAFIGIVALILFTGTAIWCYGILTGRKIPKRSNKKVEEQFEKDMEELRQKWGKK
jgi:hypothetical protein